jgi:hypothetical protein
LGRGRSVRRRSGCATPVRRAAKTALREVTEDGDGRDPAT